MKKLFEESRVLENNLHGGDPRMKCPECGSKDISYWGKHPSGGPSYICNECGYMQSESEFLPLSRIPNDKL